MSPSKVQAIAAKLINGQVGILPTDTIYGIVAAASCPSAIERIYDLKGRSRAKPFVILISDYHHLQQLDISLNLRQQRALSSLWPGPVSVILPCLSAKRQYLHRGLNSLAIRMPNSQWLRELVELTSPLVATSANLSGQPVLDQLEVIKAQLSGLDFYEAGPVTSAPSRLVLVKDDGSLQELTRS